MPTSFRSRVGQVGLNLQIFVIIIERDGGDHNSNIYYPSHCASSLHPSTEAYIYKNHMKIFKKISQKLTRNIYPCCIRYQQATASRTHSTADSNHKRMDWNMQAKIRQTYICIIHLSRTEKKWNEIRSIPMEQVVRVFEILRISSALLPACQFRTLLLQRN